MSRLWEGMRDGEAFEKWERVEARHDMNDHSKWESCTYISPDPEWGESWHIILFPDGFQYHTAYVRKRFDRKVTALNG